MNLRSGHEGYDDEPAAGAPPVASGPSRRAVLRGVAVAGALGLGGAVLAGCGSDGDGARNTTGPANGNGSSADGGEGGGGGGGEGGGGTGAALASTADIPEGGGTILTDAKVVVTQPTAGEFLGFSAMCTHQACTLATVEGGTINCSCHGSRFSIEDGSVQNGPATRPLPKVKVTVEGDQIVRG